MVKIVIQRVKRSSVTVNGTIVGQIQTGALVLVGISKNDTESDLDLAVNEMLNVCLWPDAEGNEWQLGVKDANLEILLVSQFTLQARYGNGKKPDFSRAMSHENARVLFDLYVEKTKKVYQENKVQTGEFGAMMDVEIVNDGPATLVIDFAVQRN
uniref:D-aminoacyl-tRNA deacylase n=1 Tax=Coptotermes formosanus TaxID=36987 RepID=R4UVC9_COPFO|nr:D-tyrosyl-tRNA(Tyr) deacylase [Coptotermes formosanus]